MAPGQGQPPGCSPVSPSPALLRAVAPCAAREIVPGDSANLPVQHPAAASAVDRANFWWRGEDLNLRRLSRQIYSLIPLTTREPLQKMQARYCVTGHYGCQQLTATSRKNFHRDSVVTAMRIHEIAETNTKSIHVGQLPIRSGYHNTPPQHGLYPAGMRYAPTPVFSVSRPGPCLVSGQ
jgi:hypothetical protein